MRFVFFYHSLLSDWNHGNAHFIRGIGSELLARGYGVTVYEPAEGWSRSNLVRDQGPGALEDAQAAFPRLRPHVYSMQRLDLGQALEAADVVIVHEWNEPELVRRLGEHRRAHDYRLLFHDTHHRAATAPAEMARYDLRDYDGVLAFGAVVRDIYLERGWARASWVWHEAADVRTFGATARSPDADLVWVGNWGDGERSEELEKFLFAPARALGATGSVYGVRYPKRAIRAVEASGLCFRGWIANHHVPEAFARHRVTVHVPRRPYVEMLPGVPTIRMFEALAAGIPLVCAPWEDAEGLFQVGADYLVARDRQEMTSALKEVLNDADLARSLSESGRKTILERHTCAHRVDELMQIVSDHL